MEEEPNRTVEENRWEKTHPLTNFQNRILWAAAGVILIMVAVILFFGFKEMFESQAQ